MAMSAEERYQCDMINDVQLMTDCWSRDFDYLEYVTYAIEAKKFVHPEQTYLTHCAALEQQMMDEMNNQPILENNHYRT